jgi:hypothetical protein
MVSLSERPQQYAPDRFMLSLSVWATSRSSSLYLCSLCLSRLKNNGLLFYVLSVRARKLKILISFIIFSLSERPQKCGHRSYMFSLLK